MISRVFSAASGFQSAIPVLVDAALKGAVVVALAAGPRTCCASGRRHRAMRFGQPRSSGISRFRS